LLVALVEDRLMPLVVDGAAVAPGKKLTL